MSTDAFGIEKESLESLLREGAKGRLQLPEFQRGWVWPVENITSLLASISLSYPVGTLMMLRTGGQGIRFKQRPLEGAQPPDSQHAERLVLDGQQRLTSLFQAILLGKPVETQDIRKRKLSGWFYVDMKKALDKGVDREEAFRFLPADRIVRNFRGETIENYSSRASEYAGGLFPLTEVFDSDEWYQGYSTHWDHDREKTKLWLAFQKEFIKRFQQYQLPVIELGRETPRPAVCQVFEKVNTGGVSLTVFELLTATFAADEFDLRKDWEGRRAELARPALRVLADFKETDLLQAVALMATRRRNQEDVAKGKSQEQRARIGCRRTDILSLELAEYRRHAPEVVAGLVAAAKFLHREFFFEPKFLPYGSQLVPLAAIFAVLGSDAEPQSTQERISRWFWCGVLGELYGGTTETRFARDLPEVVAWAGGGAELPRTVVDAVFSENRLGTLRTRISAAYKGIYTLLLRAGARDWRTGEPSSVTTYFDDAVDIHHIFPKHWCKERRIPRARYDSIVNKTPLAARTNRQIGGRAPSAYRERLTNSAGIPFEKLDQNVVTHLVPLPALWADDFDGFLAQRAALLLSRIEGAMGKPPMLGDGGAGASPVEEDEDEWEAVDDE